MANAWIDFLKQFKKDHPEIKQKDLFRLAGVEYKNKNKSHKQSGGQEMLTYSSVPPSEGLGTSGANLQIKASTHGGSKRRSSKRGTKRRSSKRGTKRGTKRRGGLRGMRGYGG